MNKLTLTIVFLLFFNYAKSHDVDNVAINPEDMKHATCLPKETNLNTKSAYIEELRKYRIQAHSIKNIKKFKLEHYEDILFAAKLMPSWLYLGEDTLDARIRIIYRPNLDAVANAFITLGSKWFEFNKDLRRAIIFHELAHRLDTKFYSQDNAKTWKNIDSGWIWNYKGRRRVLEAVNEYEYVSKYAMKNSVEDWAESVSAYRLKPDLLKRVSLKKYNFLKNQLFLGQEFITEESCNSMPQFISKELFEEQVIELQKIFRKNRRYLKSLTKNKKNKLQIALYSLFQILDKEEPLPRSASIEEVVKRYRFKLFIQNTKKDKLYPSNRFIEKINNTLN